MPQRFALTIALLLTSLAAAEPIVLFDFEQFDPALLVKEGADAKLVETTDGHGLALTTPEPKGNQWPGITLKAPDGKWDLTGCYEATLDVTNQGDQPVRVLFLLADPESNGLTHCSCGSGTIPPGKSGKVTVPLGKWHGTTKPFDAANVVSVRVFLDRPKAAHQFIVDNLRAASFDRSAMEPILNSDYFRDLQNVPGRGVNMGNMFEAPTEGAWGEKLKEEEFETIATAGFTNVRIPCRWNAHAAAEPPYTIDPAWFARVDGAVKAALAQHLKVVLNIHHYTELMEDPPAHRERFLALWKQIAEHYADYPADLWFELLNEPSGKLTAQPWNELLNAAIPIVRQSNPERWLVVGGAQWNSVGGLSALELPEADRRIVATFHYYSPMQFTHQGAGWVGEQAQQWLGTEWTGSDADQRDVTVDFDKALTWAYEHRRPLYLGEFGAYSKADMESRTRWTRYIADQAAERKISSAYWEFNSGFGCYDPKAHQWREGLLNAILGK